MVDIMGDGGDDERQYIEVLETVLEVEHPDERVGHLRDAEAVEVVVEGDGQVAAVDGADPVVEDVHVDVHRRVEAELDEHPAHQHHQLPTQPNRRKTSTQF